jgi:hypothetical protein
MKMKHHRYSSENAMPSFRDMLITREEAVKQQLATYIENLNHLELQKAQRGLDIPTSLSNEIEYTRKQIYQLMRELQCQEGILSEIGIFLADRQQANLSESLKTSQELGLDVDPKER